MRVLSGDIEFDEFIKFVFPTGEVAGAELRVAAMEQHAVDVAASTLSGRLAVSSGPPSVVGARGTSSSSALPPLSASSEHGALAVTEPGHAFRPAGGPPPPAPASPAPPAPRAPPPPPQAPAPA